MLRGYRYVRYFRANARGRNVAPCSSESTHEWGQQEKCDKFAEPLNFVDRTFSSQRDAPSRPLLEGAHRHPAPQYTPYSQTDIM